MQLADLADKDVLVLGLGISGKSAARFCAERRARVVAADERAADTLGDLSGLGPSVRVVTGEPFPDPAAFDITVPSPGIPSERYRPAARAVWGDIELAWRALEVPVIAVTGTNGKSTTVMLVEAMLQAAGLRAAAAGNVGRPALSLPGQPLDAAVLEVSSFQLESTDAFAPKVAVVLNLTPDHLDRHGDMHGYAEAKRRILRAQGSDDCAVLNFDDPVVRGFAESARGAVVPFSMREPPSEGPWERSAWLDTGAVVLRDSAGLTRLSLDSLQLTGRHNLENVLASITAVWAFGADPARALDALIDFRGLAHRNEVVGHLNGVTYVNDSKATNPGAAIRSLEGFGQPIVWIAGGRDKGLAFDALAEVAADRVRAALLIGEAAALLEDTLAGQVLCEQQESLRAAVRRAAELAEPGDIVLLAPACASFDQFESFEARGDHFRELVNALEYLEKRKTR
jgi:UDP-N-acetylmuramoylalanine--D-glutamate ligase